MWIVSVGHDLQITKTVVSSLEFGVEMHKLYKKPK